MNDFHFQQEEEQAALYEEELAQIQIHKQKISQINILLQEVSSFLGPNRSQLEGELKMNFPYGYLRTASQFRELLSFLPEDHVRSNIAYHLILSDFYTWLVHRTNVQGTLQEMIIKNEIVIMASICETIIVKVGGKGRNFAERLKKLIAKEIITVELNDNLLWLWDRRKGIHLFELDNKEFLAYSELDFQKSKEITFSLIKTMNKNRS